MRSRLGVFARLWRLLLGSQRRPSDAIYRGLPRTLAELRERRRKGERLNHFNNQRGT